MIEKIMRILGVGTLYLAASLFFASLILAVYFWYAWDLNRERLIKALAVAQGFDLYGTEQKIREDLLQKASDIHYETILEERVNRNLDVNLADKAVNEALAQIQAESRSISANKEEIETLHAQFQRQLANLEEESKTRGIAELAGIIESIDSELAKNYILDMIGKGEYFRVIYVFRRMTSPRNRAKIINEFQLDDELSKMAGVLRRIGNGEPEAELVEAMRQEMERIKNNTPSSPSNPGGL